MAFNKDTIFGAASAAYQIEGAWQEDGKGLNIWDVYSKTKGKTLHGENGDVACDSYHRYKEDIAVLKEMGIKYYRFSINWTRILPNGIGEINKKGLDFYSNFVDELLAAGITPFVTLFHWDYPYALHRKGGWLNDESPKWFEEYTKVVVDKLSDRVSNWFTINEPQVFIGLGYDEGRHAPFMRHSVRDLIIMSRNVMLSHGLSAKYIRENAKIKPSIGFAPIGPVFAPKDNTPEAIEEAREKSFAITGWNPYSISWWSDPIILGKFPKEAYELFGDMMDIFSEEDLKTINQPLDCYAANIYYNSFAPDDYNYGYEDGAYQGSPRSACNWPVTPEVLYWAPKFLYDRYNLPVIISENGMAQYDCISRDGKVHDAGRTEYILSYLESLEKASDEVPVLGYFYWSLLDNLEWQLGYDQRFGITYVDFRTQKRIIKDSGYAYSEYIKEKTK